VSGLRLSRRCPAASVFQGTRCAPVSSAGTISLNMSASRGVSFPQQGQCDSQCDSSVPIRLRDGAGSQKPPTRILASHWVPRASPGNSSASHQCLHVYARLQFRYRVKPALLARLVPCLRSHIVWTVRLRRRENSIFLGNDWGAHFRPRGAPTKSALISSKCSCGALGSAWISDSNMCA